MFLLPGSWGSFGMSEKGEYDFFAVLIKVANGGKAVERWVIPVSHPFAIECMCRW
mgnify:FL=1